MATIRKGQLVPDVSTRLDSSLAHGAAVLDAVTDSIAEGLADDRKVVILNFGSFEIREVHSRQIRAIGGEMAGQMVDVPSHRRIHFRPSHKLNAFVVGTRREPFVWRSRTLVSRIRKELGMNSAQAREALGAVLGSIAQTLADGHTVVITDFGSFEVRVVGARAVRSVGGANKGKLITVPTHKRVGFRDGSGLRGVVAPEWHERLMQGARGLVQRLLVKRGSRK